MLTGKSAGQKFPQEIHTMNILPHSLKKILKTKSKLLFFVLAGMLLIVLVMAATKYLFLKDPYSFIDSGGFDVNYILVNEEEKEFYRKTQAMIFSLPDSASNRAHKAINYFGSQDRNLAKLPYYNILGVTGFLKSDYTKALEYFYNTLQLALNYDITSKVASSYQNIGAVYTSLGYHSDALRNLLEANQLFVQYKDTLNFAGAQNNIGFIYMEIGDMEKAKDHLDMSRKCYEKVGQLTGIASVSNQLGMYFLRTEQIDSALYYFNKAIDLSKQTENHYALNNVYIEKGNLFFHLQQYEKAIAYYYKSDSSALKINLQEGRASAQKGIAQAYLAMNHIEKACHYSISAREVATQIQHRKLMYQINEILSDVFKLKQDYERALTYRNLALEQKNEFLEHSQTSKIYNLEIEQLNREKESQQVRIKQQNIDLIKKENLIILTLVSSFSVLVVLSLAYYSYANRIKQKQLNQNYEDKIRHSLERTKAVLSAEIQERKRVGLELHDGIGPLLSLVKLNITNLIEEEGFSLEKKKQLLQKTAQNLDDVLKEMRFISKNLAPLVLINKGFEAALKELVSRLKSVREYTVHLNINGLNGAIEPYVEHSLYRSVQEVLNNIIKHANATEVSVEVLQTPEDITVIVEDNGVGFQYNQQDTGNGMGLSSAASRIEGLRGKFFVDSMKNRGTIVVMVIPLYDKYIYAERRDENEKN